MTPRRIPPGARPRPLGSGLRLRPDASLKADAMRRFRAAAPASAQEAAQVTAAPRPTALTAMARSLYEAGVVPVADIAALCGVSERTIYKHARKGAWRFRYRREAERAPPPPAEPGRQMRGAGGRFVAEVPVAEDIVPEAAAPAHRAGLKALDPAGEARALAACEEARRIAGEALARAIARRDADAEVRGLSAMARAVAAVQGPRARSKPADAAPSRATLYDGERRADDLRERLAHKIAADDRPFWKRKRLSEMTQGRMGEPVRRLRPLLPQQADGGGLRPTFYTDVACRLLDAQILPLLRLQEPGGQGEGLRHAHRATSGRISWLPPTCGYVLVARGPRPLLVAPARLGRPGDGARRRASRCAARWS
jgi:uncharacterized cysteine cluster protein YcgN (CxxCxxCC family)